MKRDIRWLAGLLEGEGYFEWVWLERHGKYYGKPTVRYASTDADVAHTVANMFGVQPIGPYQQPRRAAAHYLPTYWVQARGARAVKLLQRIRRYMGARRQATIAWQLDLWNTYLKLPRGQKGHS